MRACRALVDINNNNLVTGSMATCTGCGKQYTNSRHQTPLVLSCGHSMCKSCITRPIFHNGIEYPVERVCKECNASYSNSPLPPTNLALMAVLEQHHGDHVLREYGLEELMEMVNKKQHYLCTKRNLEDMIDAKEIETRKKRNEEDIVNLKKQRQEIEPYV